ncbi:MAG: hypothetical protein ACRERU_03115 [Methylococcales bacterium]
MRSYVDFYIVPSAAAIWSTASRTILEFPVATYLKFMNNHGMLTRKNVPKRKCIRGGSQTYVKAILDRFEGSVHPGVKVDQVIRRDSEVTLKPREWNTHMTMRSSPLMPIKL